MRWAGFVRNVMVGRQGLTRGVLLGAVAEAGGMAPVSYLSTGNVTFDADEGDEVAARLAVLLARVLDRREPVFARTLAELEELRATAESVRGDRPVHERCVSFLPPGTVFNESLPWHSARGDLVLLAALPGAVLSETYLVGSRPGTAGPVLERTLGHRVTTRNLNTVERMLQRPTG